MPRFLQQGPPTSEVREHFSTQEWSRKLLEDPALETYTRANKLSTGETFMGETLSTPRTIHHSQVFYRPPSTAYLNPGQQPGTGETLCLVSVGGGVNGHVDKAHGGFIASLLDEVIGDAINTVMPQGKAGMTAYLKVDYKRPLSTPEFVLSRAWVESRSAGRKMFGRGRIEDGRGGVIAEGEGMFLILKTSDHDTAKL